MQLLQEGRDVERTPQWSPETDRAVEAMGGDWTQWTVTIESGSAPDSVRLTEECRMCVPLPISVVLFERIRTLAERADGARG